MTRFTGTWRLVRLALRRDRILLPIWLTSIVVLTLAVVASVTALYASAEERAEGAVFGAANVPARIFDGPASGTSLGALAAVESYQVLAILVAIMSIQAVVRHTRQDEETGRAELLGSAVVGRHARLTAALIVVVAANIVVGLGVTGAMVTNDLEWTGAIAAGAAVGAAGIFFAGVAAVTAQLSTSQRGANGIAVGAVGIAFLLRAVGDAFGRVAASGIEVISAWPSWLSPIGWGQQVRPFHQDNWGLFGLFAAAFTVLVATAFQLTSRRDVGAGMLEPRTGPARAPAGLLSPLGLAWRLQRGILLAWLIGMSVVGAAFGAVGEAADDLMGVSEQLQEMILALAADASLVELYFMVMMGLLGVGAAGYTVQALLRMRAEEATGHLEPVLATGVSRTRWLGSHALIAAAGTLAVLTATGVSGLIAYTVVAGDPGVGLGMLWAALAQVPATLALGGFVIAAFALLPRWASALAWAALAVSLVMGQLGELLELPQPVLNLSPFTHVPAVPAETFTLTPVLLLLGAAVALAGAGLARFRHRDLAISA